MCDHNSSQHVEDNSSQEELESSIWSDDIFTASEYSEYLYFPTERFQVSEASLLPRCSGVTEVRSQITCDLNTVSENKSGDISKKSKHILVGDPNSFPPPTQDFRFTIIFDLDETLVSADTTSNECTVILRPYVKELLACLVANGCEVIIWSAGVDFYVEYCLQKLDPDCSKIVGAICRHPSWFTSGPIFKHLKSVPHRPQEHLLLVENNPVTAFQQIERTLIVPSFYFYDPECKSDLVLLRLAEWLTKTIDSLPIKPIHSLVKKQTVVVLPNNCWTCNNLAGYSKHFSPYYCVECQGRYLNPETCPYYFFSPISTRSVVSVK